MCELIGDLTAESANISDYCRAVGYPAPIFNIVSDRRGRYPFPK